MNSGSARRLTYTETVQLNQVKEAWPRRDPRRYPFNPEAVGQFAADTLGRGGVITTEMVQALYNELCDETQIFTYQGEHIIGDRATGKVLIQGLHRLDTDQHHSKHTEKSFEEHHRAHVVQRLLDFYNMTDATSHVFVTIRNYTLGAKQAGAAGRAWPRVRDIFTKFHWRKGT